MKTKRPHLRLVPKAETKPVAQAAPNDPPFDPEQYRYVLPPGSAKVRREYLARTSRPFARVYLDHLTNVDLFPAHVRLWLVLLYRTREGQRSVQLTQEIAQEAGVSVRKRYRYARQLERLGAIAVEREGNHTLSVTLLPQPQSPLSRNE